MAQDRLQTWLDVFEEKGAAEADLTPELKQADSLIDMDHLARLVQEEQQRLNDHDKSVLKTDRRVKMLQARIEASENMSPTERAKLLRGLIELYGNDAWARPIVDQAAAMLAAPAASAEPVE